MDLEAQEELREGEWRRASMEELPRCEVSAEPGWEDVAEQGRRLPDGDIGLGSVGLQSGPYPFTLEHVLWRSRPSGCPPEQRTPKCEGLSCRFLVHVITLKALRSPA